MWTQLMMCFLTNFVFWVWCLYYCLVVVMKFIVIMTKDRNLYTHSLIICIELQLILRLSEFAQKKRIINPITQMEGGGRNNLEELAYSPKQNKNMFGQPIYIIWDFFPTWISWSIFVLLGSAFLQTTLCLYTLKLGASCIKKSFS